MSNQNSMSQRQKLEAEGRKRVRERHRAGEHPPAGSPWRELAYHNHREVEEFFRGEIWRKFCRGLEALKANATEIALNPEAKQPVRDEACGVANCAADIIKLEQYLTDLFKVVDSEE